MDSYRIVVTSDAEEEYFPFFLRRIAQGLFWRYRICRSATSLTPRVVRTVNTPSFVS